MADDRDKDKVKRLLSTFDELKRARRPIEPMLKEITDYLYPRRSGWNFESDALLTSGSMIFDGTAIAAHAKLADGLFGWLVSPALDWLLLLPYDKKDEDNKEIMQYLKDLSMALYETFLKSNFYDVLAEDIADCSALGTSVVYGDEAAELRRPVYTPLHFREFYISENRYGEVDTLFRDFEMTNRQLLETFEDLDPKTAKSARTALEKRVRVLHAIYPRKVGRVPEEESVGTQDEMPYVSQYLLMGPAVNGRVTGGTLLEDGGLEYRKFEAWRFRKASGQVYGISPAMDAIHDIKMINLKAKTMADAAQLAARPPMQAPESMRGKFKVSPGAIAYRVGDDKIEPIMTSLSYPLGIDSMQRSEQIIREHFKTDFFMSISQLQQGSRERTKAEVMEIKAESAAVLGSVLGRIQSERLDPLVRMTIAIEAKAGRLPPPPKVIKDRVGSGDDFRFMVKLAGPLAQSQRKYIKVLGLTRGLSAAMQLAEMSPDIVYNFKINDAARELATTEGFPYEFLEDKKTAERNIKAAQESRAQAAQMQAENDRLAAMGRAGKAAEPGSAADKIMGGR